MRDHRKGVNPLKHIVLMAVGMAALLAIFVSTRTVVSTSSNDADATLTIPTKISSISKIDLVGQKLNDVNEKSNAKRDNLATLVLSTPTIIKSEFISAMSMPAETKVEMSTEGLVERTEDEIRIWEITKPWDNVTTVGYHFSGFHSGYRNQMMMFSALVMWAGILGHDQILLPTLTYKDLYGTNGFYPHEYFFDVEYWNSFYPKLPRLVHCQADLFPNFNCTEKRWKKRKNATRPFSFGLPHKNILFLNYKHYSTGRGPIAEHGFPNPMDVLMLRGAIRPHPELLSIVRKSLGSLDGNGTIPYITLHARVEPEIMANPVCRDVKEFNLTKIFQFLEEKFPDPPAPRVFIPINRQDMERGGRPNLSKPKKTNWVAVHNLEVLNRAVREGLWRGRVQVFEFGSNSLRGTRYEKTPSTAGAILNYYIAQHAKIFIGTEISTWSMDLLHTRFYNGNLENYQYRPDGLHLWTSKETKHPPPFRC